MDERSNKCRRRGRLAEAIAVSLLAGFAFNSLDAPAQGYPDRNVRIVVPSSAGGNLTIVARAIGQKLSEAFGHQVIVDNRPGGNGAIGSEIVAHAPPDGYTVLLGANTFVSTPVLLAWFDDPEQD